MFGRIGTSLEYPNNGGFAFVAPLYWKQTHCLYTSGFICRRMADSRRRLYTQNIKRNEAFLKSTKSFLFIYYRIIMRTDTSHSEKRFVQYCRETVVLLFIVFFLNRICIWQQWCRIYETNIISNYK